MRLKVHPMMRFACGHFYVCLLVAVTYNAVHIIALYICSDWKEAVNSLASVEDGQANAASEWRIVLLCVPNVGFNFDLVL